MGRPHLGGRSTDEPWRITATGRRAARRGTAFPDGVPRRRRSWKLRLLGLLLAPILAAAGFLGYLDYRLSRSDVLGDYAGRPADTPGTNWLIVGSDSRTGLSRHERAILHTGGDVGQRTDSIMLLHTGDHGSTLISLPRDSFVPVPGHDANKLNAAFSLGGPRLLARTIELSTRIRIDHYLEIGFGGFVGMVDAVGGVQVCNKTAVRDAKAGLNLPAGCHTLRGRQALGYVRSRHAFKGGDLARAKHQREFLAALVHKAMSPAVMTNPLRILPFALRAADSFTVDGSDHLWNLASFALALRDVTNGNGATTTVPTKGGGSAPNVGKYLKWDRRRAAALFTALRDDRPVTGNA